MSAIVYGAGISGRGAAEVLAKHGEQVFLYNDNPISISEELSALLEKNNGGLVIGSENWSALLEKAGLLVLSPGIPTDIENIRVAEQKSIKIISEVELGYKNYAGHMAAITGTNGKTTTTTIVGEMFKRLPVPSAVGGNIGMALSKEVEALPKDSWFAAELSSFQLERVETFAPEIAAVLNLTPDHLDRHHTMEAYGEAKKNIFRLQDASKYTVLNYDDPIVKTWDKDSSGQICFFSRKVQLEQGIFMQNGDFVIKWKDKEYTVCNVKDVKLFGGHNEENILCAIACGFFAGVSIEDMADVLKNFNAVEHRIEYVTTINGVPYYNDSKATNTDSVIKALEAFEDGHIILLAGGYDKMTDLTEMMNLAKEKCDCVILLGAAQARFNKAAIAAGIENIRLATSFKDAVDIAYEIAQKPQVVLLSPACSSYDMFKNYPERGNTFKALVRALEK
ncbi:MAG: UDP-N-acetylmuramoyl-L-alanine--D-glutamate ligase [Phascolarctobacterium sp.]|nr:UDP-N-acetylmuramoyl-L-alanine--D-glutamate ligase [Phascolarctobacterium sp.]